MFNKFLPVLGKPSVLHSTYPNEKQQILYFLPVCNISLPSTITSLKLNANPVHLTSKMTNNKTVSAFAVAFHLLVMTANDTQVTSLSAAVHLKMKYSSTVCDCSNCVYYG